MTLRQTNIFQGLVIADSTLILPVPSHHLPLHLAHFVRDICSKAYQRTEIGSLEFDEIAYRIDSGLVCGYIQFRAGCLREVWDWVMEHGSLWLIDRYGPVYFETTSHIIGHHTIKAWQAIIHAAVKYVFISMLPFIC